MQGSTVAQGGSRCPRTFLLSLQKPLSAAELGSSRSSSPRLQHTSAGAAQKSTLLGLGKEKNYLFPLLFNARMQYPECSSISITKCVVLL